MLWMVELELCWELYQWQDGLPQLAGEKLPEKRRKPAKRPGRTTMDGIICPRGFSLRLFA